MEYDTNTFLANDTDRKPQIRYGRVT